MLEPVTALAVASLVVAIFVFIVLPKRGLLARLQRFRQHTQRVLIEDALKHVYDYEYKKFSCTLQSIAGSLAISADQAARVITRLETMGLLISKPYGFELTPEGRSYALRIIRVHRLWERYLADETSVPETEWHTAAELQEHRMSPDEVETLSRQMGNPRFDPHGDPIPTSTGEMPLVMGVPLTSLKSGEVGYIVHIEDEPQAIYAQLVAQRLYPGMQVRMIEVSNERVRFAAEGEECVLAPLFATNINVVPLSEAEVMQTPFETLSSLAIGEEATVVGISRACRGQQRRRLMDLGIVPGTRIAAEMRSASGGPTAYRIRGATIALRGQQADQIYIQRAEIKKS